jgi:molecular chaperone HscB
MTMQNHFELFHLPQRFAIETEALDRAYREVQNRVHPDKFTNATDTEKRVAMQWATRANEAYQTLKSPFKRAAYLCELNGIDLQTESNTAMPREFLMQQMEWREALEDAKAARDIDALESLEDRTRTDWRAAGCEGFRGCREGCAATDVPRKIRQRSPRRFREAGKLNSRILNREPHRSRHDRCPVR